ncbi:MAG TPA: zf-TFIIB domain-containing protein [bacterium]|nr:zf-TFIIB domain-containing protein [bacterium]
MVRENEIIRRVGHAAHGLGGGMSRRLEAQFFVQNDPNFLRNLARSAATQKRELASANAAEEHWRRCPSCGGKLAENNCKGVIIDGCPACGGIWLDKGELELLLRAKRSFWTAVRETLLPA